VAQLRGVQVLNINELANSLKPVVLPGEVMRVFILKEGKEAGQGVGYLDDGTMVVVDQARKALGKTIEVTVTSVLQTTAGKMIFCRWSDAGTMPEENGRHGARPIQTHDRREHGRDYRPVERRAEPREERWSAERNAAPLPMTTGGPAPVADAHHPNEHEAPPHPAEGAGDRSTPKAG
jgi:hypothetical protein